MEKGEGSCEILQQREGNSRENTGEKKLHINKLIIKKHEDIKNCGAIMKIRLHAPGRNMRFLSLNKRAVDFVAPAAIPGQSQLELLGGKDRWSVVNRGQRAESGATQLVMALTSDSQPCPESSRNAV